MTRKRKWNSQRYITAVYLFSDWDSELNITEETPRLLKELDETGLIRIGPDGNGPGYILETYHDG